MRPEKRPFEVIDLATSSDDDGAQLPPRARPSGKYPRLSGTHDAPIELEDSDDEAVPYQAPLARLRKAPTARPVLEVPRPLPRQATPAAAEDDDDDGTSAAGDDYLSDDDMVAFAVNSLDDEDLKDSEVQAALDRYEYERALREGPWNRLEEFDPMFGWGPEDAEDDDGAIDDDDIAFVDQIGGGFPIPPPQAQPHRQPAARLRSPSPGNIPNPPSARHGQVTRARPQREVVDEAECLARTLEMFPEIAHDHVMKCYKECEGRIQDVLDKIIDDSDYPKQRDCKNSSREQRESTVELDKTRFTRQGRDVAKGRLRKAIVEILKTEFPKIPVNHIEMMQVKQGHLYPTYMALVEAQSMEKPPWAKDAWRALRTFDYTSLAYKYGQAAVELEEEVVAARKARRAWEAERRLIEAQKRSEEANIEAAKAAGAMAECATCFDEAPCNRMVHCSATVAHYMCYECATTYIATEVGQSRCKITCPDSSVCPAGYTEVQIRLVPDSILVEKLLKLQQEQDVRDACVDDLVECPFCDYKQICPPLDVDFEFRCQASDCKLTSCRKCQQHTHIPLTCEENSKLRSKDAALEQRHKIEEAMTAALVRNCNRCKKPFIKEYGCNKMACTSCGNLQCYVCSKSVTNYDHFHKGTCPLHDNVEERHAEEIKKAEAEARAQVEAENPSINKADLEFQVSGEVKKAEEAAEKRRRDVAAIAGGDHAGLANYAAMFGADPMDPDAGNRAREEMANQQRILQMRRMADAQAAQQRPMQNRLGMADPLAPQQAPVAGREAPQEAPRRLMEHASQLRLAQARQLARHARQRQDEAALYPIAENGPQPDRERRIRRQHDINRFRAALQLTFPDLNAGELNALTPDLVDNPHQLRWLGLDYLDVQIPLQANHPRQGLGVHLLAVPPFAPIGIGQVNGHQLQDVERRQLLDIQGRQRLAQHQYPQVQLPQHQQQLLQMQQLQQLRLQREQELQQRLQQQHLEVNRQERQQFQGPIPWPLTDRARDRMLVARAMAEDDAEMGGVALGQDKPAGVDQLRQDGRQLEQQRQVMQAPIPVRAREWPLADRARERMAMNHGLGAGVDVLMGGEPNAANAENEAGAGADFDFEMTGVALDQVELENAELQQVQQQQLQGHQQILQHLRGRQGVLPRQQQQQQQQQEDLGTYRDGHPRVWEPLRPINGQYPDRKNQAVVAAPGADAGIFAGVLAETDAQTRARTEAEWLEVLAAAEQDDWLIDL